MGRTEGCTVLGPRASQAQWHKKMLLLAFQINRYLGRKKREKKNDSDIQLVNQPGRKHYILYVVFWFKHPNLWNM